MRRDYKSYVVTEADFPNVDLRDIEWLYHEFRKLTYKPRKHQLAQKAIIRFIKGLIQDGQINDFQLALESGRKKVNLQKPNRRPDFIEAQKDHLEHGLVIKKPFGIIYESEKRQGKLFMQIAELGHYSTGTLKLIKNNLRETLDRTWLFKQGPSYLPISTERRSYLQAYEAIVQKLNYRRYIQTFEMHFGMRINPFSKWAKPRIEAR